MGEGEAPAHPLNHLKPAHRAAFPDRACKQAFQAVRHLRSAAWVSETQDAKVLAVRHSEQLPARVLKDSALWGVRLPPACLQQRYYPLLPVAK